MKLIHLVLLCLLVMVVSGAFAMYAPTGGHPAGAVHSTFPAMRIGGDGGARFVPIGWAAYVFGCAFFVGGSLMMALGIKPALRTRAFWAFLVGGMILVLGAWSGLVRSYVRYLDHGYTGYFLGFPVPTAWMIYGIWGSAFGLIALFMFGFRVYVLPKEDEEAFEAFARELRERKGGA